MIGPRLRTSSVAVILIAGMFEIGTVTVPGRLVPVTGPDLWLASLLGTGIAMGAAAIVGRLAARFPGRTPPEYFRSPLGRFLGAGIALFYGVFWLLQAARVTRGTAEMIKEFLLEKTPIEVVMILSLLLAAYLVRHGVEPLARVMEILVPPGLLGLVLIVLGALSTADFTNLLPVLGRGPWPVLKGALLVALALEGFEALLVIGAFMTHPREAAPAGVWAVAITGVFVSFVFAFVVATFGAEETGHLVWPTLSMAEAIRLPVVLVERLDVLFVSLWYLAGFTSIVLFYYLAALILARILGVGDQQTLIWPLLPLLYLMAIFPDNVLTLLALEETLLPLNALIMYLLPAGLYFLAVLLRKGVGSRNDEAA